jgi:hypothetical protein
MERGAQKVSDKIVNLFEIKPGGKVLDFATCIGEQLVTAAERVKLDVKVLFILIFALRCWGEQGPELSPLVWIA